MSSLSNSHSSPPSDLTVSRTQSTVAPITTPVVAQSNAEAISLKRPQSTANPMESISREELLSYIYSHAPKDSYIRRAFDMATEAYKSNFTSNYSYLANTNTEFILNSLSSEVKDSCFAPNTYLFLENLLRELNKIMVAETIGVNPEEVSFFYSSKHNYLSVLVNDVEHFRSNTAMFNRFTHYDC